VETQHEDEPREVRFLIGSGDPEELAARQDAGQADEVTFLAGPPRSALDIADELEREQAAARAAQEAED
jgi:hypothetical protein